jgi:hypothetical protein
LDFASLLVRFDLVIITGGDPRQVLKRNFVPSTRLPQAGVQEVEAIAFEEEPITPWLEQRSCVVNMQTSYRLGPEVLELINEIFPLPFANSFRTAGRTVVSVMEVNDRWFHWDTQVSLRSSIEQNFAWSMFTCIALQALRASERHHVAIISYYSSVLAAMSLHIANLARAASETVGNGNLSNIRFLTPEAAVGHTVEVVHFIACQPRYSSDSAPQGHQLELGRRYVSLPRASERLYVWVSKMDLAEEEYTRKLQLFAKLTAIDFQQTDIVEAVRQLFSMHIRWEQARDLWSMWQWQSTSKRTETIIEMLARYTHQPSRSPCPDRYTSNLIHSLYKPDSLPN